MFKNYLKIALRNLLRYKGFTTINIASLTIGIIACLVIGLFVWDEIQYDKNIPRVKIFIAFIMKEKITTALLMLPVFHLLIQHFFNNSILKLIRLPGYS